MKRLVLRIVPATALGALLLASMAWSMGPPAGDFDHERMLGRMSEHLQLSDDQEREIRGILEEGGEQMKTDRSRLREIREALEAQRASFDTGAAQALADELGQVTSRMAYSAASQHARVYQVLNEEQRVQLVEMRAEREEHMERRWSRRHK